VTRLMNMGGGKTRRELILVLLRPDHSNRESREKEKGKKEMPRRRQGPKGKKRTPLRAKEGAKGKTSPGGPFVPKSQPKERMFRKKVSETLEKRLAER